MTGTNCDLFTHEQSRSYLNHLVFNLQVLWPCIQVSNVISVQKWTGFLYFCCIMVYRLAVWF
jgi:hypothetical protein